MLVLHLSAMQRFSFTQGVNQRCQCFPCDHCAVADDMLNSPHGLQHAHEVIFVHSIDAIVPANTVGNAAQRHDSTTHARSLNLSSCKVRIRGTVRSSMSAAAPKLPPQLTHAQSLSNGKRDATCNAMTSGGTSLMLLMFTCYITAITASICPVCTARYSLSLTGSLQCRVPLLSSATDVCRRMAGRPFNRRPPPTTRGTASTQGTAPRRTFVSRVIMENFKTEKGPELRLTLFRAFRPIAIG